MSSSNEAGTSSSSVINNAHFLKSITEILEADLFRRAGCAKARVKRAHDDILFFMTLFYNLNSSELSYLKPILDNAPAHFDPTEAMDLVRRFKEAGGSAAVDTPAVDQSPMDWQDSGFDDDLDLPESIVVQQDEDDPRFDPENFVDTVDDGIDTSQNYGEDMALQFKDLIEELLTEAGVDMSNAENTEPSAEETPFVSMSNGSLPECFTDEMKILAELERRRTVLEQYKSTLVSPSSRITVFELLARVEELKADFGLTKEGVDRLLKVFQELLPEENSAPPSAYCMQQMAHQAFGMSEPNICCPGCNKLYDPYCYYGTRSERIAFARKYAHKVCTDCNTTLFTKFVSIASEYCSLYSRVMNSLY